MTAVWGPMGWMTLHSISVCYPDSPSEQDKKLLYEFMIAFAGTITCFQCRSHFSAMFSNYVKNVPSWLNSKRDLFVAICRMHNEVNKRLDKPYPKTVNECLESLKNATLYTSQSEFRSKYLSYLLQDWNRNGRGNSYQFIAFQYIEKMKKIHEEYFSPREVLYSNVRIEEDNVLSYPNQKTNGFKLKMPKMKLKNVRWTPR